MLNIPPAASPEQVHAGAGGRALHPAARAFTVALTMAHPLGDADAVGQRGAGTPGFAFSQENGLGCSSIFCSPGLGRCFVLCCIAPSNPPRSRTRQSPDLLCSLLGAAGSGQPCRQMSVFHKYHLLFGAAWAGRPIKPSSWLWLDCAWCRLLRLVNGYEESRTPPASTALK